MIDFIRKIMRKRQKLNHLKQYKYGWIVTPNDELRSWARWNTKNGDVEFVLWSSSEQGHLVNYWHRMGCGWGHWFKPLRRPWEKDWTTKAPS